MFMEYAIDVAKACRERGILTVAVTAGEICDEPRREFYHYMDAANVDLERRSREDFYWRVCKGDLQTVLDTLVYLKHETNVWFEITTLLIPGENDSDEEIARECAWIREKLGPDVPLHFTAFHPDFMMLDKPPTPPATLDARAPHRDRAGASLRLRRQRPRRIGQQHVLPELRREAHRPRLVSTDRLESRRPRLLQEVRDADSGSLRSEARDVGRAAGDGQHAGVREVTRSPR